MRQKATRLLSIIPAMIHNLSSHEESFEKLMYRYSREYTTYPERLFEDLESKPGKFFHATRVSELALTNVELSVILNKMSALGQNVTIYNTSSFNIEEGILELAEEIKKSEKPLTICFIISNLNPSRIFKEVSHAYCLHVEKGKLYFVDNNGVNKDSEYEDGSRKYPNINSHIIKLLTEGLKDADIEIIAPEGRSNFIGYGICSIAALLTVNSLSKSKDPEASIARIKDKTQKPIDTVKMFEQVLELITMLKEKESDPTNSIYPEISKTLKKSEEYKEVEH